MKPGLQLKLSQHLALTPQLQQSIKLLQMSTIELDQEIERVLLENPLLEREDQVEEGTSLSASYNDIPTEAPPVHDANLTPESEISHDGAPQEQPEREINLEDGYDWSAGSVGTTSRDEDDDEGDFQEYQAATTNLRDHLNAQLALSPLSDRDRALVSFMIEALDDDGYLSHPLEELLELLPAELELEPEELSIALHHVQNLDPCGVGARSPSECLALQLKALPRNSTQQLALLIVNEHLEWLAARDFARLKRQLRCSDEELRNAHQLILGLNPRPGANFAPVDTRYVIPDVIVKKVRNRWTVQLNPDAMPRLRINQMYADILTRHRGASSASLGTQLQEARWLIKNVQQRFETILRVSEAIVDRQRQFFDHGEVAMRPLTLREIAEQLELHESTISRVTTQKFMATPRGILEFKYFFGSHVATDTGGACSATAIRALIRQLVGAEDPKKPLSDAKIAELLGQQGIVVARRTIAKYRESLNIPAVSQRKTL